MSAHAPLPQFKRVRFWTPGALVLLGVMAVGYFFAALRLIAGLGPTTNLTDQYPWGIWIAIDVACGVALAAGGFVTAALVNIFGRGRYHALERPALLTAWLGYSFVAVGLLFDLGRYYNVWHPMIYWQGNSVLFEVGMCVMFYLGVLTIEFSPAILAGLYNHMGPEGFIGRLLRALERPIHLLYVLVRRVLPIFIILGVVLSFMHQSSLGSLMLIAPTKVSPLWWTPILPVLFLLSAIMVGLPMVVLESMIATRSFGRPPEMHLLTPLSRIIPWIVGLYAAVKLGDLFLRQDLSVFWLDRTDSLAFLLEVGLGLILPLVLLTQRAVRRSPRLLLVSVVLVIAGVVMNRVNVFLVGFHPPYADQHYFPSFAEMAVTAGLVATIMLVYRFFAVFFPVLPSTEEEAEAEWDALPHPEPEDEEKPLGVWIAQGLALVLILGFIAVYSIVHFEAIEQSARFTDPARYATSAGAPQPLEGTTDAAAAPDSFSVEAMPRLLRLSHPYVNQATDDYEPARFLHRAHADHVDGDCTACHHRVQEAEGDRVGRTIDQGALGDVKPTSCGACHKQPNEPGMPARVGLKAAYHQQCVGCHRGHPEDQAPTSCTGCHARRVPDHAGLVKLSASPDALEVTAACLECHEAQARDLMKTAHWRWQGSSPYAAGAEAREDRGKANQINNFCIAVASNEERCAQCHVGYGPCETHASGLGCDDPGRIDCLVCHDTTGTYAKDPKRHGMPRGDVNLGAVARAVGRAGRGNCGACHFFSGGGPNVKHGDLEPALADPSPELDVHMGRAGLRCQDCHRTRDHHIAGKSVSLPVGQRRVTCAQCHGERPHRLAAGTGVHLDRHVATVSCQACHIPAIAREQPTKMFWDWSKAGQDQEATKDALGMPTFDKKKGASRWARDVTPVYRWYNGRARYYDLGDEVDPAGVTALNEPLGLRRERYARVTPFKYFEAIQPIDAERRVLAVPKLWNGFWDHFDWAAAITEGMAAVGQPFSGKVGFARTASYWGIHHTVPPKARALRCADCHAEAAVSCVRCHGHDEEGPEERCELCHGDEPAFDWEAQVGPGHEDEAGARMDFEALGYTGDPAMTGGRFQRLPPPASATGNDQAEDEEDDEGDDS